MYEPLAIEESFTSVQSLQKQTVLKENESRFQIFVNVVTGNTIILDVTSKDTIKNIKTKIQSKEGIKINQQKLIYSRKILQNNYTLKDYNITKDCRLALYLSMEQTIIVNKSNKSDNSNELKNVLVEYDLFDDIYSKLIMNKIDINCLKNDINNEDINDVCNDLQLKGLKKVKFKNLIRKLKQDIILNCKNNINVEEKCNHNNSQLIVNNNSPKIHIASGGTMHSIYSNVTNNIETLIINNINRKADDKMKLILIGDCGVGKSSLIYQYINKQYNTSIKATIGAEFNENIEILNDDTAMKIEIWDTTGNETFHSMTNSFYRSTDAVLLCFEIGNKESLINCITIWKPKIDDMCSDDVVIILVGCKLDCKKIKPINKNDIIKMINKLQPEWQKNNDIIYCNCSAKNNQNVQYAFKQSAEMVLKQRKQNKDYLRLRQLQAQTSNINLGATFRKKKRKCCI